MQTTAIINIKKDKTVFPLIAKNKMYNYNFIVLFKSDKTGTVIHDPEEVHGVGHFSGEWVDCFTKSTWIILESATITFEA